MADEAKPYELADALEQFNRKERNLLIRYALGDGRNRLLLGEPFRNDLHRALGIRVEADAWWATDYHFNWLAGALNMYVNRGEIPTTFGDNSTKLIEGNQEDIDMVIAGRTDLILIEAKAYGSWDNRQMASKIRRLCRLTKFYEKIAGSFAKPVKFYLLLVSPNQPQQLETQEWPSWTLNGTEPYWMELSVPLSPLEVTRCDALGKQSAAGQQWKVFQKSRRQKVAALRSAEEKTEASNVR